jgi:hypothetical protein
MDNERLARMQLADKIDEADGCPDELEELIAEMTEKDPDFPRKLEEAMTRQTLMHMLIQERKRQRITQKILAARMDTRKTNATPRPWRSLSSSIRCFNERPA